MGGRTTAATDPSGLDPTIDFDLLQERIMRTPDNCAGAYSSADRLLRIEEAKTAQPYLIMMGYGVLTVGCIAFEPLDWGVTAYEIYHEPQNPLNYLGLIPLVPATTGKILVGLGVVAGAKLIDDLASTSKLANSAEILAEQQKVTTVIGRMDDLAKYDEITDVDTWRKTGRTPDPADPNQVTWKENQAWLDHRIDRGDNFGIATDPATLPPVLDGYIKDVPNGYFTRKELEYLLKKEIDVRHFFEKKPGT